MFFYNKNRYLLVTLFSITIMLQGLVTSAQEKDPSQETNTVSVNPADMHQIDIKQGWTTQFDLGLNFLGNLLINPPQGGGENRFGIGASFNVFNEYNHGKFRWKNELNLAFALQKVSSGFLEEYPDEKVPFTKNIDNLRINSRISHRHSYFSKFYYALDLFFTSQITSTFKENFTRDVQNLGQPISQFLSPGLFQGSLGVDYQPNNFWSIFLSPAAYKTIIVLNDDIADDFVFDDQQGFIGSVHGNEVIELPDGSFNFKNFDHQVGAALRVTYRNEISKRIALDSNLLMFSNYLEDPDHIDLNWRNEISLTIFKGLQLSLLSLANYDHDIFVTVTDNDQPRGDGGLGRRVSLSQQILIKYSYNFDSTKPKKKKEKRRLY